MRFSKYQNAKSLLNLSNQWSLKKFDELLKDVTRTGTKIPSSDYEESGQYAVIDQGKSLIAGYSNLEDPIQGEKIVFGDHTRVLKYIDFENFHIGADGVKVLENIVPDKVLTKYIFYYLSSVDIPNTGYNRHFKYLKEIVIPVPGIEMQLKLVEIFDNVRNLIIKRESQVEALDELIQSIFFQSFSTELNNNMVELGEVLESLKYGTSEKSTKEGYPVLRIPNINNGEIDETDLKYCDLPVKKYQSYRLEKDDILFVRSNGNQAYVGRCATVSSKQEGYIYASYLIRAKVNVGIVVPEFISYYLNTSFGRKDVLKKARTSAGQYNINTKGLSELKIPLPDIDKQDEFVTLLHSIQEKKNTLKNSLNIMEELYNVLLQNAFKGELFKIKLNEYIS